MEVSKFYDTAGFSQSIIIHDVIIIKNNVMHLGYRNTNCLSFFLSMKMRIVVQLVAGFLHQRLVRSFDPPQEEWPTNPSPSRRVPLPWMLCMR